MPFRSPRPTGEPPAVRVRLLGPVDVVVDGVPRPIPGLRPKAILAALALRRGEILSSEVLVDAVWGDRVPPTAVKTLKSHVSRLRATLGGNARIRTHGSGYVLDVEDDGTSDAEAAEQMIGHAAAIADLYEREAHLVEAISLWRDRPLADLDSVIWFNQYAQRLRHLLLQAKEALIDCRLALGRHAQVLPELERLSREYPLYEPVHAHLMRALYRAGRQTDALDAYRRLRRTLDEDLGIRPSQPLQELEIAILRQDSTLDGPDPAATMRPLSTHEASHAARVGVVPAQLPPPLATLSGRRQELADLDDFLTRAVPVDNGDVPPAGARTAAICGPAGIGKTTLAVAWAHRVAARFPDGQLCLNLLGYHPSDTPLSPGDASRVLLDMLGVPAERIPTSEPARIGLYRSLLAGRRMLVLLDNARDADQVRPLLPGALGCLVVVTSRNQLTSLAATDGAQLLRLGLPTGADALELLARRIGAGRIAAEPDAVAEIITRCARLPLALAVAAAYAAAHGDFPLAAVAAYLRHAVTNLDAFHAGDPTTNVGVALACSYRTVTPDAARLFRLLGLHPGPDIGTAAAASLAGAPQLHVRALLGELTQANLLTHHAPDRYAFHDLLRAYAAGQAHACDSAQERRDAIHRVLDHYLHTANTASRLLTRHGT